MICVGWTSKMHTGLSLQFTQCQTPSNAAVLHWMECSRHFCTTDEMPKIRLKVREGKHEWKLLYSSGRSYDSSEMISTLCLERRNQLSRKHLHECIIRWLNWYRTSFCIKYLGSIFHISNSSDIQRGQTALDLYSAFKIGSLMWSVIWRIQLAPSDSHLKQRASEILGPTTVRYFKIENLWACCSDSIFDNRKDPF